MKQQHTKESLAAELSRLRADTEQVKRMQYQLQVRTSRLYRAIESIQPEAMKILKT